MDENRGVTRALPLLITGLRARIPVGLVGQIRTAASTLDIIFARAGLGWWLGDWCFFPSVIMRLGSF
jgi:hypothetical protein